MLWCACKMGDFGTVVVVGIKMAELPRQNSNTCLLFRKLLGS